MDKELKKIINDLNDKGWSSARHPWDGEKPDSTFLFAVWESFGEKNLWLYYDWHSGKYFFFVWIARKAVPLAKNKSYDILKVGVYITQEYGHIIPLARHTAKVLLNKGIYATKAMATIQLIDQDYESFLMLVSWFTNGKYDDSCAGLKSDGDKPYFIIGEVDVAIRKLKRMGYKTVQTYNEEGQKSIKYVIDGNFGVFQYDWEAIRTEMEQYIDDYIHNELSDCIWNSNYNEEKKEWLYELDLGEMYLDSIKYFAKSWNKTKPYNIKCKLTDSDSGIGCGLVFKNGFKY